MTYTINKRRREKKNIYILRQGWLSIPPSPPKIPKTQVWNFCYMFGDSA
jgi:hypothetical protein